MTWLYVLFFCSGIPALLYQIAWQRSLFAIYGVNIESVTMVVSAFMLGLGIGSLLGGEVSKKERWPLLAIFGAVEIGIGCFGFGSLRLFHFVAGFTAGSPPLETGVITFLLVMVPTTLMGSTLPLLVAHMVRISGNVGQSVGMLYFVNTLGSAAACFLAALVIMRFLGLSGSVALAGILNCCIGSIVLILSLRLRRAPSAEKPTVDSHAPAGSAGFLPFPLAMLLTGLAGYIALSYEILWYRAFSFASGGTAYAFALLLGTYLAGIAFGSLLSRRMCHGIGGKEIRTNVRTIAVFVILANLVGFIACPGLALILRFASYPFTLPIIMLSAGLLGATFPMICHVSVRPDSRAGAGLSYLYLSNIVGSTLGSFLTGFILMDAWTIGGISVFLGLLGLCCGTALLLSTGLPAPRRLLAIGSAAAVAALIVASAHPLFAKIYEEFQFKKVYSHEIQFRHVVETKSGVVTVTMDGTVFGGGVYDGQFHTELIHDTNMIIRAYAVSAFHPAPRTMLTIGLASGSWAQVLASHPQLEKLTIVEINPGYLEIIPKYPSVASLLTNPKVEMQIDDGRRWLERSPNRKFDVIVMNTTFHWRAHASNLLSTEFLRLIRRHLNPGGVAFYNTTGATEAMITGATVFPYAMRFINFMLVSDSPLDLDKERWRRALVAYRIDGRPVFDLSSPEQRQRLEEVLSLLDTVDPNRYFALESGDSLRRRYANVKVITDDNMGVEWNLHWGRLIDQYRGEAPSSPGLAPGSSRK
jgi:spermidine synthase